MFDFKKFAKEYQVPYAENEGKNTAPGWINLTCPFCDDHSNHLGFNIQTSGGFHCWKCGGHSIIETIVELIKVSKGEAYRIYKEYNTKQKNKKSRISNVLKNKKIKFPANIGPLLKIHKEYLIKRNFDPEKLEKEFYLKATSHIGPYKFRIIAPIYFQKRLVSYQGRDITNKQELRYKACQKSEEILYHKHILYNYDNARKEKVILVEGITDVWRLGKDTIGTFGTAYTREQLNLLANSYSRIFILFDGEPEAMERAEKLAYDLDLFGVESEIITIEEEDPATMSDEEAQYLKKELLGN